MNSSTDGSLAAARSFVLRFERLDAERRNYVIDVLAKVIAGSSQPDRLSELLLCLPYVSAKLHRSGPTAVLLDFDLVDQVPEDAEFATEERLLIDLVRDSLRLADRALALDPDELAAQLMARLPDDAPRRDDLLGQLTALPHGSRLRPLTYGLVRAGGPLEGTIEVGGGVTGVAVMQEAGLVVTGTFDGAVAIWNLQTGHQERLLQDAVDLDKDWRTRGTLDDVGAFPGHVVALQKAAHSVGADSQIMVWAIDDGKVVSEARLPPDQALEQVIVFDGGHRLVTRSPGAATVWTTEPLEPTHQVRLPPDQDDPAGRRISTIAVSPNGRHLVLTEWRGIPNVFDLETGRHVGRLVDEAALGASDSLGMTGTSAGIAFLSDSTALIAPGPQHSLDLWDITNGSRRRTLRAEGLVAPRSLAITPDGTQVWVGTNGGDVFAWDLRESDFGRRVGAHGDSIVDIDVSVDRVVTASSGSVRLWLPARLERSSSPTGHTDRVNAAVVIPGQEVGVTAAPRDMRVWDLETGGERTAFPGHRKWTTSLAASSAGDLISVGTDGDLYFPKGAICYWDLRAGKVSKRIDLFSGLDPQGFAVDAEARRAVVAFHIDDLQEHTYGVEVHDLWHDGRVIASETETLNRLYSQLIAVTGDGTHAVSIPDQDDSQPIVWKVDICNRDQTRTFAGHQSPVGSVAVAAAVPLVASGDSAGRVLIWRIHDLEVLIEFPRMTAAVRALALTPDASRLAAATSDQTVTLLDVSGGTAIGRYTVDAEITALAINGDGTGVIAGDDHGRVHMLRAWQ